MMMCTKTSDKWDTRYVEILLPKPTGIPPSTGLLEMSSLYGKSSRGRQSV